MKARLIKRIIIIFYFVNIFQIVTAQNVVLKYNGQILKFNNQILKSDAYSPIDVTLIIGQSNLGVPENTDIPEDSSKYNGVIQGAFIYNRVGSTEFNLIETGVNTNIDYYNGIVLDNSFGHEVVPGYNLGGYYIKSGRGSTGLSSSDWLGGDIYDSTLITIGKAFDDLKSIYFNAVIDKVIWIHGERSTQITAQANDYLNLLTQFFDTLKTDIDSISLSKGLPISNYTKYIVKLNDSTYAGEPANANVDTIQWAQKRYVLLNEDAVLIGCQECEYTNSHYSALGQLCVGWRVINAEKYNRETVELIARMDSIPHDTILLAINECIDSLKYHNYWDSTDIQYFLAAHNTQFALSEWKDTIYNATAINSPLVTQYRGVKGDGVSAHINTNFNILSNSEKFKLEDAAVHIYSRTNQNSGAVIDFGVNNTNFYMNTILRPGGSRTAANDATFTITDGGVVESLGLFSLERDGDTVRYYHNGIEIIEYYQPAVAIPDGLMYILAQNASGTAANFSLKEISFFAITSKLNDYEKYFEIIERYLDKIGAGIVF
jgi:hypothetical protein